MATIQGVYVALFGRPADPLGLQYFNTVTNNGANLAAIANLAGQKEYTDRFTGLNNNQIVNSIYQSLFNRDADPAGLNFFVNALNNGTLTINNIAIAILDGAQGTDATIRDAKIASANLFTAAIDTPTEVGAYTGNNAAALGRAFLAGISTTPATQAQADAAVAGVVTGGNAGATINLTVNADLANGTTAVAALKTTNLNDTINATTTATTDTNVDGDDSFVFGAGATADKIDAGFGVDTLNVKIDDQVVVAADQLKNVELIYVTSAFDTASINVAEAKEATQVWNKASTNTLTVTGLKVATAAGVEGTITAGKDTTFTFADVAGSSDAATLALKDAVLTGASSLTIADIETLNVSNTGTSSIAEGITAAALKSVVVAGSGSLTTNFSVGANTTVETISNAGTANLTTDLSDLDAIKTYTGGTGKDSVIIDGAHTSDVTINLAAGNDSLTVLATGVETKALNVTLGAGNDAVTIGTLANVADTFDTNAKLLATLVTITDFNKAEDAIKFDATTGGAAGRETLSVVEEANIAAATDLLGAVQVVAGTTDGGKYAVFSFKGDTYIYDTGAGAGLDTLDTLVRVTGVAVGDLVATNFEVV